MRCCLSSTLAVVLVSLTGCNGSASPASKQNFQSHQLFVALELFDDQLNQVKAKGPPLSADELEKFAQELVFAAKGTKREAEAQKVLDGVYALQDLLAKRGTSRDQLKAALEEIRKAAEPFK